nr:Chain B, Stapled peptide GAR300-Gp [synthetic construct]6T2E_B Chain B, Stapled peptide GAR300-Gm [synthetic construct]
LTFEQYWAQLESAA